MFLWDVKPAETYGQTTCTMMTSGTIMGVTARFFGGWALSLVRIIYLKVGEGLQNEVFF